MLALSKAEHKVWKKSAKHSAANMELLYTSYRSSSLVLVSSHRIWRLITPIPWHLYSTLSSLDYPTATVSSILPSQTSIERVIGSFYTGPILVPPTCPHPIDNYVNNTRGILVLMGFSRSQPRLLQNFKLIPNTVVTNLSLLFITMVNAMIFSYDSEVSL